jgi:site-specific DNA-methyltransferase (adenine-specific)
MINLYNGDCLEVMDKLISEGVVVDAIITDPPYGTTACKWDSIIPFEEMWLRLNKLIKPNGAIVLFGSEPFSSALRMSNIKNYKYDWYLNKNWITGHLNAKIQPMRKMEVCSIFNSKTYYPQGLIPYNKIKNRGVSSRTNNKAGTVNMQEFTNYPSNVIDFTRDKGTLHPTQKPIALMEYLIKTYTNENELVLDFTMGSGTTGVACKNLNRNFIGIELDENYYKIASERINQI